jgi:hypothetical protein
MTKSVSFTAKAIVVLLAVCAALAIAAANWHLVQFATQL